MRTSLYKALNFMGCLASQRRWASEPDADVKQNGIEQITYG